MTPRLASGFWVRAWLARLEAALIPAYVIAHGDETAGAVLVKVNRLDGTGVVKSRAIDPMTGARRWMVLADGPEAELDALIARQRRSDPDLWVVELESREGRDLLDEPGLAD